MNHDPTHSNELLRLLAEMADDALDDEQSAELRAAAGRPEGCRTSTSNT